MMPSNDIFAHESKFEQRQTHYAQRNSVKAQYRCLTGSRHHDIPKEQIGGAKFPPGSVHPTSRRKTQCTDINARIGRTS